MARTESAYFEHGDHTEVSSQRGHEEEFDEKGFGALSELGGCGLMNYGVSGVPREVLNRSSSQYALQTVARVSLLHAALSHTHMKYGPVMTPVHQLAAR
jgi:hypothetical protein